MSLHHPADCQAVYAAIAQALRNGGLKDALGRRLRINMTVAQVAEIHQQLQQGVQPNDLLDAPSQEVARRLLCQLDGERNEG